MLAPEGGSLVHSSPLIPAAVSPATGRAPRGASLGWWHLSTCSKAARMWQGQSGEQPGSEHGTSCSSKETSIKLPAVYPEGRAPCAAQRPSRSPAGCPGTEHLANSMAAAAWLQGSEDEHVGVRATRSWDSKHPRKKTRLEKQTSTWFSQMLIKSFCTTSWPCYF